MFFSDACADRVLKTVHSDCSISGMGLMELNSVIMSYFDKICRNIRPLTEMNVKECQIALPLILPEDMVQNAQTAADKALADFKSTGKKVEEKCQSHEFPLNELLIKLRETYNTVTINSEAVVYMASILETVEAELFKVTGDYIKQNKKSQIGRNDIRWALQNNSTISSLFN